MTFESFSYIFFYLTLTFFGSIYGNYQLIMPEGTLKRGFKIWSEKLPDKYRLLLLTINDDVFDDYYHHNTVSRFIRTQNQEYLIRALKWGWFTSWPIVGYTNLHDPIPKLEYRSSRMAYALLIPYILLIFQFHSSYWGVFGISEGREPKYLIISMKNYNKTPVTF